MPKSVRLNVAAASAPHMSFFVKGCGAHLNADTVSWTGFVTPGSVSWPSMLSRLSPLKLNLLAL